MFDGTCRGHSLTAHVDRLGPAGLSPQQAASVASPVNDTPAFAEPLSSRQRRHDEGGDDAGNQHEKAVPAYRRTDRQVSVASALVRDRTSARLPAAVPLLAAGCRTQHDTARRTFAPAHRGQQPPVGDHGLGGPEPRARAVEPGHGAGQHQPSWVSLSRSELRSQPSRPTTATAVADRLAAIIRRRRAGSVRRVPAARFDVPGRHARGGPRYPRHARTVDRLDWTYSRSSRRPVSPSLA